jgi:chaperonin GroEL
MKEGRSFLIVCDEMDENVNTTLVINTLSGALRCCVVKGIDFGDSRKNIMADISVACGGTYVSQESGVALNDITHEDLGSANKVIVGRDSTIIIEGFGDPEKIEARTKILKERLKAPEMTDYEKTKLEARIANLSGGVAIIRAGAATEIESKNKKETIEDAILASKSAIEEGCLPGCGYVYLKGAKEMMKDKKFLAGLGADELEGVKIVEKALPCIMRTVVENCGVSGDVVIENVMLQKKENMGFNAKTKKYENLVDSGILDSTKAVRVALNNAISTASTILLIDSCVIEKKEKKEE